MHIGAVASSVQLAPMSKASEATEGPGPDHDGDGDDGKSSAIKSPTGAGIGSMVDVSA